MNITKIEIERRKKQSETDKQLARANGGVVSTRRKMPETRRVRAPIVQMVREPRITPAMITNAVKKTGKNFVDGGMPVSFKANAYSDYLKALIDPARFMARVPDAYPRDTALWTTIQSFDIPILNDNFSNGKFSFACKPILGDLTTPSHFQVALSNSKYFAANGITWDNVNWSDPRAYVPILGQGKDIRVDPNAGVLTSPPPTFWGATFNIGTSTDLAPQTLFSNVGVTSAVFPDNTTSYPLTSSGNQNPMFPPNTGLPSVSGGCVILPFGDWSISVSAKFQCSTLPPSGFAAINLLNYGPVNQVPLTWTIQQPQTLVPSTGTTFVVAATVQVVSSPGHNILSLGICTDQAGNDAVSNSLITGSVSSSTITIAPANFASSQAYLSGGIIESIRPVAMATLVSYEGTVLNNGGEICANYVDNQLMANNFYQVNQSGIGQLQNYVNLRGTKKPHDGPIKDGAYCIWAPYDVEDIAFRSPSEMNARDYPGIVVSGVFSPDAAVNASQSILRTYIWTTFEYTTQYACIGTTSKPGSTEAIEAALQVLRQSQFATENANHLANIKRMIAKGVSWYKNNSAIINPAIMALGSALL